MSGHAAGQALDQIIKQVTDKRLSAFAHLRKSGEDTSESEERRLHAISCLFSHENRMIDLILRESSCEKVYAALPVLHVAWQKK